MGILPRPHIHIADTDMVDAFIRWADAGGEVDTRCLGLHYVGDEQMDTDEDMATHSMEPMLGRFAHVFGNLHHLAYSSTREWSGTGWLASMTSLRTLLIESGSGKFDLG